MSKAASGHIAGLVKTWTPWWFPSSLRSLRSAIYVFISGLCRCGKLWQSTLVRYFISQAKPGYVITTKIPKSSGLMNNRGWKWLSVHSLNGTWMAEGREPWRVLPWQLNALTQKWHITFGHSLLTHHPINHKGPRRPFLPCAQKVESWKYLVNSTNAHTTLVISKSFWTYLWDGKQPQVHTGIE